MTGRSDDLFKGVQSALARLCKSWLGLVLDEQKPQEVYLAAGSISAYLQSLADLEQHRTRKRFLPACFEMYASCVGEIMKACRDLGQQGSTIKITTVLTKPLSRWYNISRETTVDGFDCALTRDPWEAYKNNVVQLNDLGSNAHNIQMRRIVTFEAFEEGKPLFVYVPESGTAITVKKARRILDQIPDCVQLDQHVRNTIDHGDPDWLVHLIGTCSGANCSHAGWQSITKHFKDEYHVSKHHHRHFVQTSEKGVFYAIVPDIGPLKTFEDLFIVDMRNIEAGIFGIAFDLDRRRELPGMIFLADEEMNDYIQRFDDLWNQAGSED